MASDISVTASANNADIRKKAEEAIKKLEKSQDEQDEDVEDDPLTRPDRIRRARELIAAGNYSKALHILRCCH